MTDNVIPFPQKEEKNKNETTLTFSFDIEGEDGAIYNFSYDTDGNNYEFGQVSDGEIEKLCDQLIAMVREYPELKDPVKDILENMISYMDNEKDDQ